MNFSQSDINEIDKAQQEAGQKLIMTLVTCTLRENGKYMVGRYVVEPVRVTF